MVTIINRTKKIKYKYKRYKRSKKSRLSKRSKKSRFSKRSNNKSRSCFYQSKGGGKLLDVLTIHHIASIDHTTKNYGSVESEMLKVLKEYCDLFLKSFKICGINCNNYLFKKLSNIVHNDNIDPTYQETIILQIQDDFTKLINEVIERVTKDKALLQKHLGIPQSHTLVLVECLGDESHNHGKIALKLLFNDSKSIVYKPRSLLAEHVLCNKTNSVFQMANLGTYTTIDLGNYGYQEYLENNKKENTMTPLELDNYMKDIATTEKICKQLRISDLHHENVVTYKKKMLLIDLEVYLVPVEIKTPTGLMNNADGGGEFFCNYDESRHNLIWLKDKEKPTDVTFENLEEKYHVKIISPDEINLSLKVIKEIDNAKQKLMSVPGRLVVITTFELRQCLRNSNPDSGIINELIQFFEENKLIRSHLSDSDITERIRKAYQEDFLHNDIPIFYYNSIKKIITYHDITIGSIPTTPELMPELMPGSMPELMPELMPGSMPGSLQNFRDNLPLPKLTDSQWSQYVGKMRDIYGEDWLNIIKENMKRSALSSFTRGMQIPAAAVVSAPAVNHHHDMRNYMAMDGDEPDEMEVG
jgi:hypothetical protein